MSNLFNRLQDEIEAQEHQDGISPIDLLDLPSTISSIVKKIIRHNGMKLSQIAEEMDQPPEEVQKTLDGLVEKGYMRRVEVKTEVWYKARFAKKKNRTLSSGFWNALDQVVESDEK